MTIRTRLMIYLVLIHLGMILVMIRLYPHDRLGFFLTEFLFLTSLAAGFSLFFKLWKPFDFLKDAAEWLRESDYNNRFNKTGDKDLDRLIDVYNNMLQSLHEETLRQGEQRGLMEKLLEATPLAVLTLDFDQKITLFNPAMARMLGPLEKHKGQTIEEIDHPLAELLSTLERGEHKVISFAGKRRLKCICDGFKDRGFWRPYYMVEDITEELHRSEIEAYGKLIRVMSHEVNNTIGAAGSLLNTCLDYSDQLDQSSRNDFNTALNVVITRMDHLNAFMRGYANLVRIPEPVCRPTDLVEMVRGIYNLFTAELDQRQIQFEFDMEQRPVLVKLDQHQMEQVLINIIRNAMQAIESNGKIRVKLVQEHEGYALFISDSGRRLTQKIKENLFSPFYTTKKDGQGIGLTLIKGVLIRHRFDFSLEGNAEEDTCFTVRMYPSKHI